MSWVFPTTLLEFTQELYGARVGAEDRRYGFDRVVRESERERYFLPCSVRSGGNATLHWINSLTC